MYDPLLRRVSGKRVPLALAVVRGCKRSLGDALGEASHIGTRILLEEYPLPPFILQNLEKTRFILRLSARSLSLKNLYAKSREHGSYELGTDRLHPILRFGSRSLHLDCQKSYITFEIIYYLLSYLM